MAESTITPTERQCTACQAIKPITEFYRNKLGPGGRLTRCKLCQAEASRHIRQRHKAIPKDEAWYTSGASREKRCPTCRTSKQREEFGRKATTPDGYRGQCRACEALSHKRYHEANRERALASARAWKVANAEHVKAYDRADYEKNRAAEIARAAKWSRDNKARRGKRRRERYAEDEEHRQAVLLAQRAARQGTTGDIHSA